MVVETPTTVNRLRSALLNNVDDSISLRTTLTGDATGRYDNWLRNPQPWQQMACGGATSSRLHRTDPTAMSRRTGGGEQKKSAVTRTSLTEATESGWRRRVVGGRWSDEEEKERRRWCGGGGFCEWGRGKDMEFIFFFPSPPQKLHH